MVCGNGLVIPTTLVKSRSGRDSPFRVFQEALHSYKTLHSHPLHPFGTTIDVFRLCTCTTHCRHIHYFLHRSFFFLVFTSLMLLEKRAEKKWGKQKKWQIYKRKTPVLCPLRLPTFNDLMRERWWGER